MKWTHQPSVAGLAACALALAILAAGCGGGVDVTPQALEAARATWEKAGPRDYDLEWSTSGIRENHFVVTVRDGEVTAIKSRTTLPDGSLRVADLYPRPDGRPGGIADPSLYSIPGLFGTIADELAQLDTDRPFDQPRGTPVVLKFEPDPALGYPRRYIRDVAGSPRGLSIEVTKLTPVAPDP